MKHIICRRAFLLFSAMALSLSVIAPRTVLAEESSPYGEIDGDPVVSEIALSAKELNPPEDSERSRKLFESVNNALFYCSVFAFTPNFFAKNP